MIKKYPPSSNRIFKPKDLASIKLNTEKHKTIHPSKR
jgi:hypothetical protein